MAKFKVAVIVGSLRKDSYNLKLGKALAKLGQDKFDAQFFANRRSAALQSGSGSAIPGTGNAIEKRNSRRGCRSLHYARI